MLASLTKRAGGVKTPPNMADIICELSRMHSMPCSKMVPLQYNHQMIEISTLIMPQAQAPLLLISFRVQFP